MILMFCFRTTRPRELLSFKSFDRYFFAQQNDKVELA